MRSPRTTGGAGAVAVGGETGWGAEFAGPPFKGNIPQPNIKLHPMWQRDPKKSKKSNSEIGIENQNRTSKSNIEIEHRNRKSKSKFGVETQNRKSKSKIGINARQHKC